MDKQAQSALKQRVDRLITIHLRALAAFNAYEQIQEFRAPNILGKELAKKNAQAIGNYRGFFNTAEKALNTELHISLAKLFDSHKDALHVEKLINFAEEQRASITQNQEAELDEDFEVAQELASVYTGLNKQDLLKIRNDLVAASDKIARLKKIRDKEVAHLNYKQTENSYLTYSELLELIELSQKVLNLVSHKNYGEASYFGLYEDQVINDTKALLELVGSHQPSRAPRASPNA